MQATAKLCRVVDRRQRRKIGGNDMSAKSQGLPASFRLLMTWATSVRPVGRVFMLLILGVVLAACGPIRTSGAGGISFDRPAAMALDGRGTMYIADGGN